MRLNISKVLYFLNRYSGILNTAILSYGAPYLLFISFLGLTNCLGLTVGGSGSVSELRRAEEGGQDFVIMQAIIVLHHSF